MDFLGVSLQDVLGNSYFMTFFNVKREYSLLKQALMAYGLAVG